MLLHHDPVYIQSTKSSHHIVVVQFCTRSGKKNSMAHIYEKVHIYIAENIYIFVEYNILQFPETTWCVILSTLNTLILFSQYILLF